MADEKHISWSWRLLAVWLALPIAAWGQVDLVSVNSAGTAAGNALSQWSTEGPCRQRCVSSDGRYVVFTGLASNLTAISDTNFQEDVFVRDRLAGTATLVSVNLAGTASGNGGSFQPMISADGNFVAFLSSSTNLVAVPVSSGQDLYVRDLLLGTTTLVSINSAGTAGGNSVSNRPVISADGSRVAFGSNATDLVTTTDANGAARDVFVRDLTAGTTTLVSINSAGTASGNATSGEPTISADGNRIAFESEATNLVPGFVDGNAAGLKDVFVRDLGAGTTALVSINSAGTASGNAESGIPAISEDGSHVAYQSLATNLTSLADANGALDLLVRDLGSGTTFLATVNSAGTAAGNFGFAGWLFPGLPMSTDGKRVVFTSLSNNLVASDTNAALDVFVRDLTAGGTTLVSINSGGTASGAGASSDGFISAAGNLVVFRSLATDLVTAPPVVAGQAYERELTAGTTTLVSLDSAGSASAGCCATQPLLSGGGSTVVFLDTDTTLVTLSDTNADIDVFAVGPILSPPTISINDVSVTEGDVGTVTAGFTVSLSAASGSTVTVDFITNGVTATSGTDFVANSGTVTFLPTQVTQPVSITVNGDTLDEINETFTVDLSNATNATIADLQGVGTITDNDPTLPGSGLPGPLVSLNSGGTGSANGNSFLPTVVSDQFCHYSRQCMSTNGRFVVFVSEATNLAAVPDTNGDFDVFVRDTLLGTTTLVTINSSGTAAANSGVVLSAFISADGTKVAFVSSSSDLVATDTNGTFDVFVRDLVGGTTTLVSVNAAGTDSGSGFSWFVVPNAETPGPVISADGNRVVFNSDANNLVATDTNGGSDAFVRDLSGATTTLVSVNLAGTDSGNLDSSAYGISADGNRVVFSSYATDLVAIPDANGLADIFVRDLMAGTTTLVSINAAGTSTGSAPGDSRYPVISDDGTHVAFLSFATDLTTIPDTNVDLDLFVRDLGSGTTLLASVNAAGTAAGNNGVSIPGMSQTGFSLSANGNRVAFSSAATDLTTIPDSNGTVEDLFARDLGTGTTFLVTVNSAGTDTGNAGGETPVISADGAKVFFSSDSTDLVTLPLLSIFQVYERDLAAATTTLVSINSAGTASGNGASDGLTISGDGSTVAFNSSADDLTAFGVDTNGLFDVFVRPLVLTPSISINDVSVTEGDVGTVTANFTVSLSAASGSTVTVDFITNGVTATSGTDFAFNSGTLTFLPTQVTQPVSITVNSDLLDEFNETFTVDLSNASNANIADTQGVGTILDNDPPPTISINDVSQPEGNVGTTNMTFTVSLSAVSGKNVSVNYLTADNSANQPSDYTLTSGTLMILAGNPSGPIPVPIVGETAGEANETFFVNLSVPVNATLLDSQGQGTITDDDSGPLFSMSPSSSSITCTAGASTHFNVTVTPSAPPLNTPVAFSCSGNPPASTCTITPSSVTPGSSPASAEVRIQTTASSALLPPAWERGRSPIYAVLLLPGLGLIGLVLVTPGASKRRLRRALEIALLLAVSLALMTSGCGGGGTGQPGTPSGTYTVVITGTSGSTSHSTNISLTIHP